MKEQPKYDQHKVKRGQFRKDQLEQGFFDGRFVSRTQPSKKLYTRKNKHKKNGDNIDY